jgi:hypothetical protein
MQENTAEKIKEETIEVPLEPEKTEKEEVTEEKEEVTVASEEQVKDKEEELNEYSEKVQKRIGKLTAKMKEHERREKAALQFAESAKQELANMKAQTQQVDTNYVKELENRVTIQKGALETQLKTAIESGDTDTQVKIQTELANLAQDNNRLEYIKQEQEKQKAPQQPMQQPQQPMQQPMQQPQQPPPDPKALAWGEKNKWFGSDEPMTLTAFNIHKQLIQVEGFDGTSDDYYEEMDKRIREQWPQKFNGGAVEQQTTKSSGPAVASVNRNSGNTKKKSVKLTSSELAIARKLGVTPEQYAKQVLKLQAGRNVNTNS